MPSNENGDNASKLKCVLLAWHPGDDMSPLCVGPGGRGGRGCRLRFTQKCGWAAGAPQVSKRK